MKTFTSASLHLQVVQEVTPVRTLHWPCSRQFPEENHVLWWGYTPLFREGKQTGLTRLQTCSGLSSWVLVCHVCLPYHQISLKIIEIIILKPKIFIETWTQEGFRVLTLVSVISFPKLTNFALAPFFSKIWSYVKFPRQEWNPGQFSVVWPSCDIFLVSINKRAKFGENRYIRCM